MVSSADEVEAVINEIGFGRWQWFSTFVILIVYITGPVQQLGSTFLSAPVPFRCSYSEYAPLQFNSTSFYRDDVENEEFPSQCLSPIDPKDLKESFHQEYAANSSWHATGLPSCPQIRYDTTLFQSTVFTEWDLVCENAYLRPVYQMMFSVGSLICSTFGGQLSDWLGRRRTFQIGGILTLSSVVATSIVPWYGVMLLMRIMSGTGTVLMVFATYTLMAEISPMKYRTVTSLVPGAAYFAWLPAIAGVAYLVPHWRWLILICNVPLLLLVPLTFTIDESPRWMLQTGRQKEAVAILKKAAKQNGIALRSQTLRMLDSFTQESSPMDAQGHPEGTDEGTLSLLKKAFVSPGMRRIMIVSPLMMFLKMSLHIGVLLNANNFTSTNPFEYMAILGAMGVVSIVASIPVSQRLGRRVIIGGALFIGGALMLLELPVPAEFWWLKLITVMASYGVVCAAFQVTFVYRAELFPTVIRTRGYTFTNLAGAVGEMAIPLVTEIAVLYKWWAASVTFGLTGLVGSLLFPLLPETKGEPMPETLQDVEERYLRKHLRLSGNSKMGLEGDEANRDVLLQS